MAATCKLLQIMVRPARFERATFCSGGKRSIQLSYGRSGKPLYIVYQRAERAFAKPSRDHVMVSSMVFRVQLAARPYGRCKAPCRLRYLTHSLF